MSAPDPETRTESEAAPAEMQESAKPAVLDATVVGKSLGPSTPPLTDREKFQFICLRNARYHEDRERFFARWHRIALFVIVFFGSAAFAAATQNISTIFGIAPEDLGLISSMIVTLAGLSDLVFDFSGMASRHSVLRRTCYDLLAQSVDSTRQLPRLEEEMDRLYATEPPTMHGVNAIAYNNTMASMLRPEGKHLYVGFGHRLLRHYLPFASTKFKTYDELGISPGSRS